MYTKKQLFEHLKDHLEWLEISGFEADEAFMLREQIDQYPGGVESFLSDLLKFYVDEEDYDRCVVVRDKLNDIKNLK